MSDKYEDSAALRGKTIASIKQIDNDRIEIETSDGKRFAMFHSQDCCESVIIHTVTGDLQSLVGSPLLVAREEAGPERPADIPKNDGYAEESETWTTYFFETETAKVRIVWHGSSNGYYSESVQLEEVSLTSP